MPDAGLSLSPDAMRMRALETLACLVGGRFGEQMRIEAAARILVTARRVAMLAAAGALETPEAPAPGPVVRLASRWDTSAITAEAYAQSLTPAEIAALLEDAPAWAETVWASQRALDEAEKARLLQRV